MSWRPALLESTELPSFLVRQNYAAAVAAIPGPGLPMTRLLELFGVWDGLCTRVQILQVCDGKSVVQKPDVFTAVNRHYDLRGMNGSPMGVGSFCWAEL